MIENESFVKFADALNTSGIRIKRLEYNKHRSYWHLLFTSPLSAGESIEAIEIAMQSNGIQIEVLSFNAVEDGSRLVILKELKGKVRS